MGLFGPGGWQEIREAHENRSPFGRVVTSVIRSGDRRGRPGLNPSRASPSLDLVRVGNDKRS